jgi:two-component system, OmpR family, response regulator
VRILLIEDDAVLQTVMLRSLSDAGHRLDAASDLSAGEHFWRVQTYEAVLLDLNLPVSSAAHAELGSGLQLLRSMRAQGDRTPVLVLTARNRTEDYLGKPFDLEEVEARLRALSRRTHGTDDLVRLGRLALHRKHRRILLDEVDLALPAREFEVLWELMSPPGRAVSKRALSDKLSGFDEALGDNALEAFISRLRKKLAGSGATIRTLRGIGYVLEDAPP